MKLRFLLLFIVIPILCRAQTYADHLIPDCGIYGIFDYQFDYYSNVRTVLFKGLSDKPEVRFLVMPSFTPENVLDIQKDNKEDKYYLVYRICERMIWTNKNWEEVKVKEYKAEIDFKSVQLMKSLYLKAIKQTKHPEEEELGMDGVNYYFFAWDYGLKTGTVWSPQTPKMRQLVEIGNELINLAKKSDSSIISFNKNFIKDIEKLDKELEES